MDMQDTIKNIKKAYGAYLEEKGIQGCHVTEENFAFYMEGLLKEEERNKLEDHLAGCSECLEFFLTLREVEDSCQGEIYAESLPASRLEQIKEILSPHSLYIKIKAFKENLEIIFTSGQSLAAATPAFAVRGAPARAGGPLVTVQKEWGSLRVEVEVEQVKGGEKEIKVVLKDRWTEEPQKGLVVSLIKQNRILASYVARDGQALFGHLAAGRYHIKIFDRQNLAGQIILELKGESHEGRG